MRGDQALWLMLAPVLIAGVLLGILLVVSIRQWRTQNTPGHAITVPIAEHIARCVLRRATSAMVAALVGLASALVVGHGPLAFVMALISIMPLGTRLAARDVLHELDGERARAELRNTVLIVRSRYGQSRLATSRRLIDAARRNAVPASIARAQNSSV